MDDYISRQAAIDVCNCAIDLWENCIGQGALISVKKKIEALPSAELEPIKKLHIEYVLTEEEIKTLKQKIADSPIVFMPSALPEIIRCGQCKYAEVADKEDAQDGYTCQFHRGSIWFSGSYCSWAERRNDDR